MKKLLTITAWTAILAPGLYLLLIWQKLPARVPLHFDLHGNADRYGSKAELITLVIVLSLMSAGMFLLFPYIYKIDPKKSAIENKDRLKKLGFAISILMSFLCFFVVDSSRTGSIALNVKLLISGLAAFWCIMGNYMYNLKPNYFAGMRLPWTLQDEENWKQTHLLAGKLWFAGGLLTLILVWLIPTGLIFGVFIGITIIITLIPIIYSYQFFRRKQKSIS